MDHDHDQHRHRCEVRQLLAWRASRGLDWCRAWLADVARHRGAAAAARLRVEAQRQWELGNRGVPRDWREG